KFSTNSNSKLSARNIDKIARDYLVKQGFPAIPHSLGHGIGIDVHELPHLSPHSKDIIGEGMVFSIEPGIYIENYGGVRIEDLVMVTKTAAELISHANRDLIEL
ncbi:MAG: M24 family metallopeptidase, partial [Candidatus Levybacteria bacterium]|nr:M24 family metallopeptidase [Candidatus Levybacteria bacterium]